MRVTPFLQAMVVGSTLLFGSAGLAQAADFCIHVPGFSFDLVLKAFLLPGRGACKEARGFKVGEPQFVNGSACTSSDGSHTTFVISSAVPSSNSRGVDVYHLDLATGTGTASLCVVDTGSGGGCTAPMIPISRVTCNPKIVPVP